MIQSGIPIQKLSQTDVSVGVSEEGNGRYAPVSLEDSHPDPSVGTVITSVKKN